MPEVNLGKVVGPKGSDGAQGPAGADGLSAYEQAQAGGYSGSELEFNQQLAGLSDGPFVPESDKGVASGVATLDSTGKVPSGQLPSMDYIPTSQKGAASGVASLDATGKLEETQKPDYTASEVGAVPTTRTVNGKELSADVTLTGEDIKTSASDETTISSQLSNLESTLTTPPQVFDLPLSDGWAEHRASEYFKTQENIVTVYFQVHTSSPQGGEIILARLPEGFRPQNTIGGSGYCGISGEKNAPADMKVYPNGDVNGFNDVGAAEYYTGFFTFVAAS